MSKVHHGTRAKGHHKPKDDAEMKLLKQIAAGQSAQTRLLQQLTGGTNASANPANSASWPWASWPGCSVG